MGEGIGGLLNATFGNAAELIIALTALRAGLHDVVEASIAGSIVGNMLLVLGAAMLAGGLRHREQQFNPAGARSEATMLVTPPALFAGAAGAEEEKAPVSVGRSILVLAAAAIVIAWMSEILVAAIEPTTHEFGFSKVFVGVCVVAILGLVEGHATARRFISSLLSLSFSFRA